MFTIWLAIMWTMQILHTRLFHLDARRSTCWTFTSRPSEQHGAWWKDRWWWFMYRLGIYHAIQFLQLMLTMIRSILAIRSYPIWIFRQLTQGVWRWIWCNDDSQSWYIARYVRGAYREQNRTFWLDPQTKLQVAALLYILFIIICLEIFGRMGTEAGTRLHHFRQGRHHRSLLLYNLLIGHLQDIMHRLLRAHYNMGLSGPKSGCSGTRTSNDYTHSAAEVRVWLYASSQGPGSSIQALHDRMSGKLCVNLSLWFQEYCSKCKAMLQTGQRWAENWHDQAFHTSATVTQPGPAVLYATFHIGKELGKMMRMWIALHVMLLCMVQTVQAGTTQQGQVHYTGNTVSLDRNCINYMPHQSKPDRPKFQKRALRKAILQAQREPSGQTTYKGRLHTHGELQQSRSCQKQLRRIVRQPRQPKSQYGTIPHTTIRSNV